MSAKIAYGTGAIAVLMLLVAAGCDSEEPSPAPTATVRPATPTPLTTTTPAATTSPEAADGVEVVPIRFGEEAAFPEDVALVVETGCWQCDGPPSGLYRVYRDASGQVRTDTLFTIQTARPQPDHSFIHSLAVSRDGSEIVVSVCSAGECEWMVPAMPQDRTTLYRSTDGGVTWTELGVLQGTAWARAITKGGVLLSSYDPAQQGRPQYRLFPGDQPVEPPAEASGLPATLADGELAWPTEDGRLLRSDGSEILALGEDASFGPLAPDASGERLAITWWTDATPQQDFLGIFSRDGRSISAFSLSGFTRVGGWVNDTLVAGNASIPPGLPIPEGRSVVDFLPAITDIDAAEAHLLASPFNQPPFGGRDLIRAVVRGPFARVVNTGSCLNVRAEPAMTASALTCAADGVLLRDTGETQEIDGVAWLRVVTSAGAEGWASSQYLER